jgi:hypothetical protein
MSRTAKLATDTAEPDFHGAAIIDDQGNEIAITEDMVRSAICALDSDVYVERQASNSSSERRKS